LQVCDQQGGLVPIGVALLLGQQTVIVLDDGVPDCTLNLGGQSVLAVKAMTFRVA
jgi:hypothetical protein